MRRRIKLLLLCLFVFLAYVAISLYSFFIKIFGAHSGVALTQNEVLELYGDGKGKEEVIPRIIHQIYHDWSRVENMGDSGTRDGSEKLPDDWERVSRTCKETNPDWEYMLWNTTSSLNFLGTHYPSFLRTYTTYPHPVQRVDSLRYFLIYHYGGIYIDLDNGCSASLKPLLTFPAFTTDGGQGALSNNILGSAPKHAFWKVVVERLETRSWDFWFPYVTVSEASGQWFLTECWELWFRRGRGGASGDGDPVRIMMDMRKMEEWVFWTSERGGTWVRWDNRLFAWVGDHLVLLGGIVVGSVMFGWLLACRKREEKAAAYKRVEMDGV